MNYLSKPRIVVSQCFEFDSCRYNGQMIPESFVRSLVKHVEFVPVCPELEIGLGVPRDPVKVIEQDNKIKLVQPSTEKDLTSKMNNFSKTFLDALKEVDGFILKAGSPSCGIRDVKVYPKMEPSSSLRRGSGLFAQRVLDQFEHLAIENEQRLSNFKLREHFLIKIFALARFRDVKATAAIKNLVDYHSRHKYLIMAYNQSKLKEMGRIVANDSKKDIQKVLNDYEQCLWAVFKKVASFRGHVNVLMHMLGYFKEELKTKEKQFLLKSIEQYRNETIPLIALLHIVKAWILKYDKTYLENQFYLNPFPEELISLSDSGKGRIR